MPFRQLPNTDASTYEALRAAKAKADSVDPADLAFPVALQEKLNTFLPAFGKEVNERGAALSVQSEATKLRTAAQEKCKMYVSHFYQVFNFGISRGEYKATERGYFQVDISNESVPEIKTESDLIRAANNIVNGEQQRTAAGCKKMENPSADEVKLALDDYNAVLADQSGKKDIYQKEQEDVDKLRPEALELVKDIWDEIEFKLRKDEPSVMRRKAREYGVVYVARTGEEPDEDTAADDEPAV